MYPAASESSQKVIAKVVGVCSRRVIFLAVHTKSNKTKEKVHQIILHNRDDDNNKMKKAIITITIILFMYMYSTIRSQHCCVTTSRLLQS